MTITGGEMNQNDLDDAIQASLASFTRRFEEASSHCFDELRKCSFFDPVPSEWLIPISKHADIRTFSAGDCLTSEGDSNMNAFYVLLYGSATVYCNNKVMGKILSGECVGEGIFFSNGNISRSATVIADGQIIAAEFKKDGIDHLCNDAEAMVYMDKALLLALFKKLQGANRRIEELLG
jgi:CRP-like cAMP-binding protein